MNKQYYAGFITMRNLFKTESGKAYAMTRVVGNWVYKQMPVYIPVSQCVVGECINEQAGNYKFYIACWVLDKNGIKPEEIAGFEYQKKTYIG